MKKVQTVLGPISPEDLGVTYPHAHVIIMRERSEDPDFGIPNVEKAIEELQSFKEAGGKSIVDGTTVGPGRDVKALIDVAKKTSVNIVATTGFGTQDLPLEKWVFDYSIDQLTDFMTREITAGIDGTEAKAGALKASASYNCIKPVEEKVIRAVARVQLKTDAPVFLHTTIGTMALEQLEILEEEGVNLSRVMVGHLDRNPDLSYHREILKKGAYVLYDQISKIKYHPVSFVVELILKLFKEGYGKQILLSLDFARKSDLKAYGGGPGYTYLLKSFVPRLKAEGLDEEAILDIFINNPKRILSM